MHALLTVLAEAATPQHRTVLPGARPTANRSQIPLSNARIDTRHSFNIPHASQSSSLPHQMPVDGPIHRSGTSTPRGYGGISGGMKVGTGRAGTAGDVMGGSRYGQYEGRSILRFRFLSLKSYRDVQRAPSTALPPPRTLQGQQRQLLLIELLDRVFRR